MRIIYSITPYRQPQVYLTTRLSLLIVSFERMLRQILTRTPNLRNHWRGVVIATVAHLRVVTNQGSENSLANAIALP